MLLYRGEDSCQEDESPFPCELLKEFVCFISYCLLLWFWGGLILEEVLNDIIEKLDSDVCLGWEIFCLGGVPTKYLSQHVKVLFFVVCWLKALDLLYELYLHLFVDWQWLQELNYLNANLLIHSLK